MRSDSTSRSFNTCSRAGSVQLLQASANESFVRRTPGVVLEDAHERISMALAQREIALEVLLGFWASANRQEVDQLDEETGFAATLRANPGSEFTQAGDESIVTDP